MPCSMGSLTASHAYRVCLPAYDIKRHREPWRTSGLFLEMIGLLKETDSKERWYDVYLGLSS